MGTRIALFDDNKNIRNSIVLLLSTDPAFEIVGSYSSASNCIEKVLKSQPDIILMDIEMVDASMLRQLKKELPRVYILIQTVFENEERILKLIAAGASGYMLKSSLNQSLRSTMMALKKGHQ